MHQDRFTTSMSTVSEKFIDVKEIRKIISGLTDDDKKFIESRINGRNTILREEFRILFEDVMEKRYF